MDRRHFVVNKTRELLGSRLDETLQIVRQDRAAMRGWEEPAPIRSVLRRSIVEQNAASSSQDGNLAVAVDEFVRNAGEPDRGQQRECLGQILESAACALEKMISNPMPELSSSERLGLECVLMLYARPSLLLTQGKLGALPEMWNCLEEQREDIEMVQRGIGRI